MKKIVLSVLAVVLAFGVASIGFAADAEYIAGKGGERYHLPTCPVVKQIKAASKVTFKTPEEAIKAGYTACKICNPPAKSEKAPKYVAAKDGEKFHKMDCRMVGNMKEDNKVFFATKAEAEKAGFKPCAVCFPPDKKQDKSVSDKPAKPKKKN